MTERAACQHAELLPPLDSKALDFDISHEMRRTVVDLMRGQEPTTILGVLLVSVDEGVTVEALAKRLDRSIGLIAWNVEKLEQEDLCVRTPMDGDVRVLPLAAYTDRNDVGV